MSAELEQLRTWVGRTETRTDEVTAAPQAALSATLDREDPAPQLGTVVPPLWHWLYFTPVTLAREIGPDGHPKRGGFLPPRSVPRRRMPSVRFSHRVVPAPVEHFFVSCNLEGRAWIVSCCGFNWSCRTYGFMRRNRRAKGGCNPALIACTGEVVWD